MKVIFSIVKGIYELSGTAWAEKPERAHGQPGYYQIETLTIGAADAHNTEVATLTLDAKQLIIAAEFGFCVDALEQELYEAWQERGYE